MNWFFIDFKILRSEKIGHAHDKSKCLPDNCCDGSTFYTHIKGKNKNSDCVSKNWTYAHRCSFMEVTKNFSF